MNNSKQPQKPQGGCETCQFFDYDEEWDDNICTMNMDEDDLLRVLQGGSAACPFYRYYDEYTMVRKQN